MKAKQLKSITMMFTAYGQGGDAERIAMYVEMLADIPDDVLDKVCKKAVYESKYLPSIAELVQSANNFIGEVAGQTILPWDEAWKEIEKAVKAFGWQELCEVTIKELPIVRAQLRDMHNGICEQSRRSKINNYVMGDGVLIERVNVRRLT